MTILLQHKVDSGDNVKKALCLLDVDRPPSSFIRVNPHSSPSALPHREIREGVQKNQFFLGKSPKLWEGGGQES